MAVYLSNTRKTKTEKYLLDSSKVSSPTLEIWNVHFGAIRPIRDLLNDTNYPVGSVRIGAAPPPVGREHEKAQ